MVSTKRTALLHITRAFERSPFMLDLIADPSDANMQRIHTELGLDLSSLNKWLAELLGGNDDCECHVDRETWYYALLEAKLVWGVANWNVILKDGIRYVSTAVGPGGRQECLEHPERAEDPTLVEPFGDLAFQIRPSNSSFLNLVRVFDAGRYTHDMAHFDKITAIIAEMFPNVKRDGLGIEKYTGPRHANMFGVEFYLPSETPPPPFFVWLTEFDHTAS